MTYISNHMRNWLKSYHRVSMNEIGNLTNNGVFIGTLVDDLVGHTRNGKYTFRVISEDTMLIRSGYTVGTVRSVSIPEGVAWMIAMARNRSDDHNYDISPIYPLNGGANS